MVEFRWVKIIRLDRQGNGMKKRRMDFKMFLVLRRLLFPGKNLKASDCGQIFCAAAMIKGSKERQNPGRNNKQFATMVSVHIQVHV